MKPAVLSLRFGQSVWAVVEESLAENELLINFGGDLMRVVNSTSRTFRTGERVQLFVEQVKPLRLKLIQQRSRSEFTQFERTI